MRTVNYTPNTPQRKIMNVSDKFGNDSIKKQQGTTRVIYDSIPIDGRSEYRFFEEANTRQFPLTNMSSDGNKLGVGGALAIERIYLSVVQFSTTDVIAVIDLGTYAVPGITVGELAIEIANSQVLKQVPLLSFDPRFNKSATYAEFNNFEFDTQLVLNPLLEFVFKIRVHNVPADEGYFLRLTVEGAGAIIAPKTTM
jgi:hypothetical protein